MLKTTLRFLVVAAIGVALGAMIYHLAQPGGAASLSAGFGGREFGEHELGEGGGLLGLIGNLGLVGLVTLAVTTMQKALFNKGATTVRR